jgi:hypothetical protein
MYQERAFMKPKPSGTKFHRANWRVVLFALMFGAVWGTIPGVYHRWAARREYEQRYSKLLELPSSISAPRAHLQRMPGVVGKALWIDFYQPNADEDDKLRAWFVKYDGFSDFKGPNWPLPKPIGEWEAVRAKQFLIESRDSENGWVHICLGQRMPPEEAEKDLATYPWQSEMKALHSRHEE